MLSKHSKKGSTDLSLAVEKETQVKTTLISSQSYQLSSRKQITASVTMDVRKGKTLCTIGVLNWISIWRFHKKG